MAFFPRSRRRCGGAAKACRRGVGIEPLPGGTSRGWGALDEWSHQGGHVPGWKIWRLNDGKRWQITWCKLEHDGTIASHVWFSWDYTTEHVENHSVLMGITPLKIRIIRDYHGNNGNWWECLEDCRNNWGFPKSWGYPKTIGFNTQMI